MDFITARLEALSGPLAIVSVRNPDGQDTLLTVRIQALTSFDLRPGANDAVLAAWSGSQPCLVVSPGGTDHLAVIEPVIGGRPLGAVLADRGLATGLIAPYPVTKEVPPAPPTVLQRLESSVDLAVGIAIVIAILLLLSQRNRYYEAQREEALAAANQRPGLVRRVARRLFGWRHFARPFPTDPVPDRQPRS